MGGRRNHWRNGSVHCTLVANRVHEESRTPARLGQGRKLPGIQSGKSRGRSGSKILLTNLGCVAALRGIVRQMSSVPGDGSRHQMLRFDFNSWPDGSRIVRSKRSLFLLKGRLSWRMMSLKALAVVFVGTLFAECRQRSVFSLFISAIFKEMGITVSESLYTTRI